MRSAYVGRSDSVAAVDDHLMVLVFVTQLATARFPLIGSNYYLVGGSLSFPAYLCIGSMKTF